MRVSAYCRVSTDHEDQVNSYETQKAYFTDYITRNLDWELTKLYADKGISGTSTKKRREFQQMIIDAENHKFELIITKEVSRFARNTVDTLTYVRKLKALGIGVIFLNDSINTLDSDGELRLTIMASLAQEESRKTSQRVLWGMQRSMEKGVVLGNHFYGYHKIHGKLVINEEEATIVREIFDLYLNGFGTYRIEKEMESRGILSPAGLPRWKNVSILRILANEKYCGDLRQKKEITIDYLEHKRIANDGREDFITIRDNHQPIIDRETFDKVQEEIAKRQKYIEDKSKFSNMYCFSSKIKCMLCGATYQRRYWNGKHEQKM